MALRKLRITLAAFFYVAITLLFLDFTGTLHAWLGWMTRIQFVPALLTLNVGVLTGLVLLTLVFGRIYCSIICPLGVMQDIFGWLGKRAKKNRYSYSAAKNLLRYSMLGVMVVAFLAGIGSIVVLFAPYSAYGRIVQNIMAPLWQLGNNILAAVAERWDSYAFYTVDIWIRSTATLMVAVVTFVALGILAWRNGRTYCNTICPVGTILGFLSRFSIFRPVIDTSKCNGCGLCARNCKGACIDSKAHHIDYSRCVACMDCVARCNKGAISYGVRRKKRDEATVKATAPANPSRREFLTTAAWLTAVSVIKAEEKTVDGGLAVITDKKIPARTTPIVPPGARSLKNMGRHCTGCQLCVSACPNGVLRPSTELTTFMQPTSSYERGYCRPECTRCSEVCPTGAITKIGRAEKTAIQIGHAVWIKDNCIPLTDGVECGNCARHCQVGAIQMVVSDVNNPESPKIPIVNEEQCIGCGACENLCPSRPFSAIYVEGHQVHRTV